VIFSLVQEEKAGEARPFFRQRITNSAQFFAWLACYPFIMLEKQNKGF